MYLVQIYCQQELDMLQALRYFMTQQQSREQVVNSIVGILDSVEEAHKEFNNNLRDS